MKQDCAVWCKLSCADHTPHQQIDTTLRQLRWLSKLKLLEWHTSPHVVVSAAEQVKSLAVMHVSAA